MMATLGAALGGSGRLDGAERTAALGGRVIARRGRIRRLRLPGLVGAWFRDRDMPAPARVSFRRWWRSRER